MVLDDYQAIPVGKHAASGQVDKKSWTFNSRRSGCCFVVFFGLANKKLSKTAVVKSKTSDNL